MDLAELIRKKAIASFAEVVDIRRHLHTHPELSFKEFQTSDFIKGKLREYGIEYKEVAKTGVVATITGKKGPGHHSVALRAELDALPVTEDNELPFKSVNEGIMHACGHDVHAACLLGSARILKDIENDFSGTVFFIFQPGEESLPGGAKLMMDENIFGDKNPAVIIAQHVLPELEAGVVGLKQGIYMASGDEIYISVSGKGGHGAIPHKTTDTVVIMCQIVIALQQISSRFAPPNIPTVLSFGKFTANGATNIIPKEVQIEGTFRTMDETWRAKAHEIITNIATKTASSLGADCSVEIRKGYPVLYNDPEKTGMAKSLAETYNGKEKVTDLPVRMTTEDFAWFAQKYPAVFYRLGTGKPDNMLHTPDFDIDEQAMITGTGLPAWLALSFLKK